MVSLGALSLDCSSSSPSFIVRARGRNVRKVILALVGFPAGPSGQESTCQCRRRRFDPCVGKIPWSRRWQPFPVFLPGKSPGQGRLVGHSP